MLLPFDIAHMQDQKFIILGYIVRDIMKIYVREGNERDAVGISRRGTNHNSDLKEKVEMDRSHPKETG